MIYNRLFIVWGVCFLEDLFLQGVFFWVVLVSIRTYSFETDSPLPLKKQVFLRSQYNYNFMSFRHVTVL